MLSTECGHHGCDLTGWLIDRGAASRLEVAGAGHCGSLSPARSDYANLLPESLIARQVIGAPAGRSACKPVINGRNLAIAAGIL